jgi:hypothetical protein
LPNLVLKIWLLNWVTPGRPHVVADKSNNLHAVWHDDGSGINKRQIFYSFYDGLIGSWSEPELIVSDSFSSSNPQIACDTNNILYVIYETTKS